MRDQTVQLRDIMLKYAKGRGHAGRIVGSVNPLVPKPGTSYQWLPMADTRDIERKMKRLHAPGRRHRPRVLLDQERTALLLPGADVARRSPRGPGHRSRRAQRRPVAAGGAGIGRRRRLLHLPRSLGRPRAAVGHHRRRHEGHVLPQRVRQGPARGMDAAARSASRRTRDCCRCCRDGRPRHHGPARRLLAPEASADCSAAWASNCAYALSTRSRT